jgi:hypothetical protein
MQYLRRMGRQLWVSFIMIYVCGWMGNEIAAPQLKRWLGQASEEEGKTEGNQEMILLKQELGKTFLSQPNSQFYSALQYQVL